MRRNCSRAELIHFHQNKVGGLEVCWSDSYSQGIKLWRKGAIKKTILELGMVVTIYIELAR